MQQRSAEQHATLLIRNVVWQTWKWQSVSQSVSQSVRAVLRQSV